MACGAPCLPGDADHRAASAPIANRDLIHAATAKVYSRGRKCHLVSADF
jgi:hypothetical protein